jgi:hypothetical protein
MNRASQLFLTLVLGAFFLAVQGCKPIISLSSRINSSANKNPQASETAPTGSAHAMGSNALRIIRPLDHEIIDFKRNNLPIRLNASKSTFVTYEIRNSQGTVLQQNPLYVTTGEREYQIPMNVATRSHRGGYLTFKMGDDSVQFGLGLLFLVAGQSNTVNAQCSECTGYTIPPDPHVVYLNDAGAAIKEYRGMKLPFPEDIDLRMKRGQMSFDPLPENRQQSPGGAKNVWIRVGKILSESLGMPVGFVIVGIPATSIQEWTDLLYPRMDYGKYLSLTAVLWHQGEGDAFLKTSTSEYLHRLNQLVGGAMNRDIRAPWVVSRASSCAQAGTTRNPELAIEAAQNLFIRDARLNFPVYVGPNTNLIPHPCHFDTREQYEALISSWVSNLGGSGVIEGTAPRTPFFAYSTAISGAISSRTVRAQLQIASAHQGRNGAIYIVAVTSREPFQLYYLDSTRTWRKDDGVNTPPAFVSGTLPDRLDTWIVQNEDLSGRIGTDAYLGYGIGSNPHQEMMNINRYRNIYNVQP